MPVGCQFPNQDTQRAADDQLSGLAGRKSRDTVSFSMSNGMWKNNHPSRLRIELEDAFRKLNRVEAGGIPATELIRTITQAR